MTVQEFIVNIHSSIVAIVDNLIGLAFQPLYVIINIIETVRQVWTEEDQPEESVQPQVSVYPSTNEGRISEECDYPIGFLRNKRADSYGK